MTRQERQANDLLWARDGCWDIKMTGGLHDGHHLVLDANGGAVCRECLCMVTTSVSYTFSRPPEILKRFLPT